MRKIFASLFCLSLFYASAIGAQQTQQAIKTEQAQQQTQQTQENTSKQEQEIPSSQSSQEPPALPTRAYPKIEIKTNLGSIFLELYDDIAPKTVTNFLRYVKKGHFNKTIFHRVIDNFMIQGGGLDAKLAEKPTEKPIANESKLAFEKGLKNDIGTIAMARMQAPNSATSQFFINVNNNDFLNYQVLPDGDPVKITVRGSTMSLPRAKAKEITAGYTPFGKVISGWDVVEKIKAIPTHVSGVHENVPNTPITVITVQLVK